MGAARRVHCGTPAPGTNMLRLCEGYEPPMVAKRQLSFARHGKLTPLASLPSPDCECDTMLCSALVGGGAAEQVAAACM